MDRAINAIERIAVHAQDTAQVIKGFPETTYVYNDGHAVAVCACTQSIQVQFNNLWAYYAPGRKVSFQEGDEEMLVEVARALEEGIYFAM